MRGDRPLPSGLMGLLDAFTPHARGSTSRIMPLKALPEVYPACAGIDLVLQPFGDIPCSLPRMRGDRPR